MKLLKLGLLVFWIGMIALGSCARRGVPTGGPKDTIPPTLLNMSPELETVNFEDDELVLNFDEFIEARSIKQDLIINPPVEEYDFFVNRRSLVIELNEELQENTTYTFNFRDAIKDVSEQNPAENIVMAFSTGSKIDSFQVQGNVRQLLTNVPAEDILVTLYPESDTLSPFEDTPTYLTKTDEEGNYAIRYIRVGTYKLYAFKDENNNLKIDSNNEPFGFEAEPVLLIPEDTQPISPPDAVTNLSSPDSTMGRERTLYGKNVDVTLFHQDIRPIEIQSSRANGKYFEIKTNKALSDYKLIIDKSDLEDSTLQYLDSLNYDLPQDTTRYLYSNFQDQQKTIRIYNTLRQDSLQITLMMSDSVDQTRQDTLYVNFAETRRERAELKQTITTESKIKDTLSINITFSKPITQVKTDSILLSYDTLFYIPLNYDALFQWNKRLDQLSMSREINRGSLLDTLQKYLQENDSITFFRKQERKNLYLDSLQASTALEEQITYLEALVKLIQSDTLQQLADSINALEDDAQQRQILSTLADTLGVEADYQPKIFSREELLANPKPLVLYLAAGSFISVEQDSSQQIIQQYSFKKPEEYGTITGNITTEYESYTIQLLDKNYTVIKETVGNGKEFTFELIPPGEYKLRVLIDEDLSGSWDKGNILENREPEPIYFYTEEETIELRANWQRELNLVF